MAGSNPAIELLQRAVAALQRRAFGEAADLAQAVLQRFGPDANALMVLASVRMETGDVEGAIALYERAREVMPEHIHVLVNLAAAYRASGRLHEARMALEAALKIDRKFAIAHNNLANVLLDLDDVAGARREYERAVVLDANYADPVAGLARIAEGEHRLDDAQRLAERALRVQPQNVSAGLTLAKVRLRKDAPAEAVRLLEALLRNASISQTNRVVAEGSLGEAYDRLGRYDDAFAAFGRANALQHAQHTASFAGDRSPLAPASVARLASFVAGVDVAAWRAAPPAARMPVFLVGFPRSGTTLLDQILASHPQITTLEERDTLIDAASALITPERAFDQWASLSDGEIERLRASYWEQVRIGLGRAPTTPVFVDKLPLNAVFLPVIHRLFPEAKILFALRDPRDVVLSCYQQRFGMNAAMFQLLRLDAAAAYYDAVMDLVRISRSRLPLNIREVRYEALISEFEPVVRDLLAFLDLAWDEAVRGYAETAKKRAIGTPSAAQVVRPLYDTARGKWRNYRKFLEPYLPRLEPWVQAFGYEPS
jgi:tetratricopeptide (TPR) repeat protein